MSARWEEALEAQLELFQFWGSEAGRRFGHGFGQSVLGKSYHSEARENPTFRSLWDNLADLERIKTFQAEPIYVSPDMMELIEAAMDTFTFEPVTATDFITPAGFMYLPKPLYFIDNNNKRCSYRAIAWYPSQSVAKGTQEQPVGISNTPVYSRETGINYDGVWLSLYAHIDDDDDINPDIRQHIAEARGRGYDTPEPKLSLLHAVQWWFNERWWEHNYWGEVQIGAEQARNQRNIHREIHAALRLSMQYVAVREQRYGPRATRRRAERLKHPRKNVTVITLRRPRSRNSHQGETHIEWDHRWLVSGHWRNQWYPSLNMHRQIYINPYVKGPDDKELVIPKLRAFEFVR